MISKALVLGIVEPEVDVGIGGLGFGVQGLGVGV